MNTILVLVGSSLNWLESPGVSLDYNGGEQEQA
jgi:hypothetical protein